MEKEHSLDFIRNNLFDIVQMRGYESFALTVNQEDYVPRGFLKKIHKLIFKDMKRKFSEIRPAWWQTLFNSKLKKQSQRIYDEQAAIENKAKEISNKEQRAEG